MPANGREWQLVFGLLSPMAQVKAEVTIISSTSEFWFGHGIPVITWFNGFSLQDYFTQVARQGVAVLVGGPLATAFAQQCQGCRGGSESTNFLVM